MSKRYCKAKSCAVIALVTYKVFNIANVGDCADVLRMRNKKTKELQPHEVSTHHSYNYLFICN